MKMTKRLIVLLFLLMFIPLSVGAVNISESEKACNELGTQSCGRKRMCAIKTNPDGSEYCGLNDSSRESFERASGITRVNCGNLTDIPKKIPDLTSMIVRILWIIVPIILVIFGSIDLAKGVVAAKDDEIKKGQRMFIKRLVTGVIIFLIVAFTKFIVGLVAEDNTRNVSSCIDCFINGECRSE